MKISRHRKIIEIINKMDVETQEELAEILNKEGYNVTQATVSRDIRELKLTKVNSGKGQRYVVLSNKAPEMTEKYRRIFKDGFIFMDMAQNILVIKTVSGMAGAVCASIDAMNLHEIVGSIAGDDTIMCAIRTTEDTVAIMKRLRKIVEQ